MSSYKEIAEKAGVSIGTVYRVLHSRGRFSADTAERVREIARGLGYKKNIYASNLSRSRVRRIAIVMPDPSHDNRYWQQPHDGITSAINALEHYKLTWTDCFYDEHDPDSFRRVLDEARSDGPDAAIIAPSLAAASEQVITAGSLPMPHVMIDTLIPGTGRIGYVGQDSYASGRAAGRLLRLLTSHDGSIAAVRSLPASSHIERRIQGVAEHLREHGRPDARELDLDFADHTASREALAGLLSRSGEPVAWFVSNSNASILADLLDELAGARARPIVGYDLVPENVAALAAGRLSFLLSQRPEEQGRRAVEMIYRTVILGEHERRDEYLPIDIVSPETIESHLAIETEGGVQDVGVS
ncbi:MAG: substrate-binding domain-containing protein [Spirochaetota bacterium]